MKEILLKDGFGIMDLGCDTGTPPSLLPRNQAALAINATFRDWGYVKPRPGFVRHDLTFSDAVSSDQSVTADPDDDYPQGTTLPTPSAIDPALQLYSFPTGAAYILLPMSPESGILVWSDLPATYRSYAMGVMAAEVNILVPQYQGLGWTYVGFLATPIWNYNSSLTPGNLRNLGAEADGATPVPYYTFGSFGWSLEATLLFQQAAFPYVQPTPIPI